MTVARRAIQWCRSHLATSNLTAPVIIPLSGGLDSAVTVKLLTAAVGATRVIAVHAKHETTTSQETEHATEVAKTSGCHFVTVDVHQMHHVARSTMDSARMQLPTNLAYTSGVGSIQKVSGVYAIAREITRSTQGRLCGTLDASEILTGYFPKDLLGGDLLPLGGLLRTEVRQLAEELGVTDTLPDLPVMPGCGSIVGFANRFALTKFQSEALLDAQLERMVMQGHLMDVHDSEAERLRCFCGDMKHKVATTLLGRPVNYTHIDRKLAMEAWARGGLTSDPLISQMGHDNAWGLAHTLVDDSLAANNHQRL